MEVLSEQVVTDNEAKEIIESRINDTEPKYDQKNSLEVLKKFVLLEQRLLTQ